MKWTAFLVAVHLMILPLTAIADQPQTLADERSSTFVSGAADPSEAFGRTEGPVLLIVGMLALATAFVLLAVSKKTQIENKAELCRMEQLLKKKGDDGVK